MFNYNSGYSLADIAAATGGNKNSSGWGDDGSWWIIVLFLFAFNGGWGNGGFGGNGGATTREEIAYGFDMNGLENGVRGIQQGLCDGFYAMNTGMLNGFSGVQSTLCQGFSGVNNAIGDAKVDAMQNTFGLQNAINAGTTAITGQLASMAADSAACCCATQRLIESTAADLSYKMATQDCETRHAIADSTRDIIDSNNAGVRSILEFLTQDKIATLQAENQSLKLAASQAAQNAYLVNEIRPCPVPAYTVPNPYCCYTPTTFAGCGGCTL
jgi:hypothetical protein